MTKQIGQEVYDDENEEVTKEYSTWRRFTFKYAVSTPILVCFILAVLSAMLSFFRSHDQMIATYNAGEDIQYFSSSSSSTSTSSDMTDGTQSAAVDDQDVSIHLTMSALGHSDFWAVLLLYPSLYGILIGMYMFMYLYLYMNTYTCIMAIIFIIIIALTLILYIST